MSLDPLSSPVLPQDKMRRLLEQNAALAYAGAQPFPHVVVDDFFDPLLLARVVREFPDAREGEWKRFHTSREMKLTNNAEAGLGPATRALIHHLNSAPFLAFLTQLTGIESLIGDPYLDGGGLHQILPGGKLGLHVDYDRHPHLGLRRRLNLLLYLNEGWEESYGGHFEMWDKELTRCHRKVSPVFNRMVIFTTSDSSFHGHPDPLRCPPDRSRKSLALYYFTNDSGNEALKKRRGTLFRARPGEKFSYSRSALLRSLVPPIVADIAQNFCARFLEKHD